MKKSVEFEILNFEDLSKLSGGELMDGGKGCGLWNGHCQGVDCGCGLWNGHCSECLQPIDNTIS